MAAILRAPVLRVKAIKASRRRPGARPRDGGWIGDSCRSGGTPAECASCDAIARRGNLDANFSIANATEGTRRRNCHLEDEKDTLEDEPLTCFEGKGERVCEQQRIYLELKSCCGESAYSCDQGYSWPRLGQPNSRPQRREKNTPSNDPRPQRGCKIHSPSPT